MDDFLKSIEDGTQKVDYNIKVMLTFILGSSIRNEMYIKSIFDKVYPDEQERRKIVSELEAKIKTEMNDRFAKILTLSKEE